MFAFEKINYVIGRDAANLVARTLYNKSTRHQTGAVECLLHGADAPPINAPDALELHQK
ncbi:MULTISPECIES: hypothetical protein [unclassified Bradyrhizobium]|uniref:hypothetical protein n=1 Tax=unclassified Bradyrhizobium TaxID=2631580 RepID=UPI00247A4073|nr:MULTISPECIES: hypothetical protein [unclassified Bradyrhizobium]WGS17357.1 hypothetical protein MTX22_22070 [Bradyrhizobium sp. ISRA463]WGS31093.1 hypothetical protein MTX19_19740 [Bradyrhizobium sp. ISRA464]